MAIKKKKPQTKHIPFHIWIGILFIAFILIGSLLHSNGNSTSESTNYQSTETDISNNDSSDSAIWYHVTKQTYAATCEECYDEMFDYFKVNDEQAIQSMIFEGKIKMLYEGQRLYLVDGGYTYAVLKEKGSRQKLWVVTNHIEKE